MLSSSRKRRRYLRGLNCLTCFLAVFIMTSICTFVAFQENVKPEFDYQRMIALQVEVRKLRASNSYLRGMVNKNKESSLQESSETGAVYEKQCIEIIRLNVKNIKVFGPKKPITATILIELWLLYLISSVLMQVVVLRALVALRPCSRTVGLSPAPRCELK